MHTFLNTKSFHFPALSITLILLIQNRRYIYVKKWQIVNNERIAYLVFMDVNYLYIVEKQKKILSKITEKDTQFINLSVTEKDTLFINVITRTLQPLSQFIQSSEWHLQVEEVSCTANK